MIRPNDDAPIDLNGTFLPMPAGSGPPGLARLKPTAWPVGPRPSEAHPRLELVLDGASLLPFHFLRTGDRLGRAVLKIQREDGSTGTGFLVAPDVVLTNHHVLPDEATAASCVALANFEVSPPNDPSGRPAASTLDPDLLFLTNADLDFTFCGVRGLEYLGVIPLDRERMHINASETVSIIQHPRGRPKEVALRENRVVRADAVVVQYAGDTEPGSSGSPVFNNQWRPVAIHHASVLTDSPEGRRVAADSKARYLNEGIRLSAIALWLETAEANGPAAGDQTARLRGLFGGLNHRAGFFGALGRRSRGRAASEVVAETYRDHAEMIDVGFWDLRPLARSAGGLRDHASGLGRAIADFGLDVWCLAVDEPDGFGAVRDWLRAAHGLAYRSFLLAGAEGSTVVLFRASKSLRVAPLAPGVKAVRVLASGRDEAETEVVVVPVVTAEGSEVEADRLVVDGSDRLFVGDVALARAVGGLGDWRGLVAASGRRDGAAVFAAGAESGIGAVFVSANLEAVIDPEGLLSVAVDRALPASLDALPGPRPFAVRLSLEPPAPVAFRAEPRPVSPEPPPETLDALIERKLRELIDPMIARILEEALKAPKS